MNYIQTQSDCKGVLKPTRVKLHPFWKEVTYPGYSHDDEYFQHNSKLVRYCYPVASWDKTITNILKQSKDCQAQGPLREDGETNHVVSF